MNSNSAYDPFAPYTFNLPPPNLTPSLPLPPNYFQQPQPILPYVYGNLPPLLNQPLLPQLQHPPPQLRQLTLELQPLINSDDSLLSQDSGYNEGNRLLVVEDTKRVQLGGEFFIPQVTKPSHPVILNASNSSSGNLDDLFSAVNAATNEHEPVVQVVKETVAEDNPIWTSSESAQLFDLLKNSIDRTSKDWNWESVSKDLNIGRPAEQCQARWNRAGVVVRNSIRAKLEANFRADWIRKNFPFDQQPNNQLSHHQYHPRSSLNKQPHFNQSQYNLPPLPNSHQSKGYNPYLPSGSSSNSTVKPKKKQYNKQPTTMISSMEEFGAGGGRPKRASAVKALKGFKVAVSSDSEDAAEIIARARKSRAEKNSVGGQSKGKGKGIVSDTPAVDDMNVQQEN